jgi:hypothetical protein
MKLVWCQSTMNMIVLLDDIIAKLTIEEKAHHPDVDESRSIVPN